MFAARAKPHPANPANPHTRKEPSTTARRVHQPWESNGLLILVLSEPFGHTLHSHLTTRDAEPSPRVAVERGHAPCDESSENLSSTRSFGPLQRQFLDIPAYKRYQVISLGHAQDFAHLVVKLEKT